MSKKAAVVTTRTGLRLGYLAGTSAVALSVAMAMTHPAGAQTIDNTVVGAFQNSTITSQVLITGTGTISASSSSSSIAFVNSGSIGTLSNAGTIYSRYSTGIRNVGSGTIATLTNSGLIQSLGSSSSSSGAYGIRNRGTLGALTNSGTILGRYSGVYNANGSIGAIVNTGTIVSTSDYGISNYGHQGSIGSIGNSGLIQAQYTGIENEGVIGTLTNTGVISSGEEGLYNSHNGSIGALTNAVGGTINASGTGIYNYEANIGALTNAGVINSEGQGIYNYGSRTGGHLNGGTIGALTNSGLINASRNGIDNEGVIPTLTNSGTILSARGKGIANYGSTNHGTLIKGIIGTLTNSGVISSSSTGIYTNGSIGALINSGTIAVSDDYGIFNGGRSDGGSLTGGFIGSLSNSGVIRSYYTGIENEGVIGTLTNSGTIAGSNYYGIYNAPTTRTNGSIVGGTIGTLTNNGLISSAKTGIYNSEGVIGTLINTGTIMAGTTTGGTFSSSHAGITNYGSTSSSTLVGGKIGTLTNSGTIIGNTGIYNEYGSIGTLSNSGSIGGGRYAGVYNYGNGTANNGEGVIGTLTNTGTITGGSAGIYNSGYIGGISNTGSISGINNISGGTIANAVAAISNSGGLGHINNEGVIAGNIVNNSANDLTIATGISGTLTGFASGTQGTITNTLSNLYLINQNLNDTVNVGANTVFAGGNIVLDSVVSVTGNYSQRTGTISEAQGADLVVSGAATLTTISVNGGGAFNPNANYLVGDVAGTLVQGGAGSSYTNDTVTGGVFGLTYSGGTTVGNNLVGIAGNDYVGSTLGSINNSGTLGSIIGRGYADLAVYVGTTGNLGTLNNNSGGVIVGNDVAVGVDTGGTVGVLTNSGTIRSSRSSNTAIGLRGSVGVLTNSGLIGSFNHEGVGIGVDGGSIGTLTNSGTITGRTGVGNRGFIGGISNTGTIYGVYNRGTIASAGNAISNSGSLGRIDNEGVIAGNISNTAGSLTISGYSGTLTGFVAGTQGTITNLNGDLDFQNGQRLNDSINVGTHTVTNLNGDLVLLGNVSITGNYLQNYAGLDEYNGSTLSVSGTASITNSSITGGPSNSTLNYAVGDAGGVLVSAGTLLASNNRYYSDLVGLAITGTQVGNSIVATVADDYVGGTLATLTNSGVIAAQYGLGVSGTGSLGSYNNTGTLSGTNTAVVNQGVIGTLTNTGTIAGNYVGIQNANAHSNNSSSGTLTHIGTIGTLTNSGTIVSSYNGIANSGTIGVLTNDTIGTIIAFSGRGIDNYQNHSGTIQTGGVIGALTNSGTIAGYDSGIANFGTIGTLTNNGSIGGYYKGIYNQADVSGGGARACSPPSTGFSRCSSGVPTITGGQIGTLVNNGVISATRSTAIKNQGGSIGTLTNSGSIFGSNQGIFNGTTNTGTLLSRGSIGALTNSGTITSGITAIKNFSATIGALTNSGSIGGRYGIVNTQTTSHSTLTGGGLIGTLTNSGTITAADTGVLNQRGVIGTLVNSGQINAYRGIVNNGNFGERDGAPNGSPQSGLANGGVIGVLTNSGTISTSRTAIENNEGSIGALTNSGLITVSSSRGYGIYNYANRSNGKPEGGTIGTLSNSGTIATAYRTAIYNEGNIGTLSNSGTIHAGINNEGAVGIGNYGTTSRGTLVAGSIGTLTNSGLITGTGTGINTEGAIGTLTNSGTIIAERTTINGTVTTPVAGRRGIYNGESTTAGTLTKGFIGTLTNSGTILSYETGIKNYGSVGALTNSGTIASARDYGIYNYAYIHSGTLTGSGSIGTLTNSGTIASYDTGIYNDQGVIGTLINSGTITSTNGYGIENYGRESSGRLVGSSIGTLVNSGLITASYSGIYNDRGNIGTLVNSGTIISTDDYGISNYGRRSSGTLVGGSIGTLTNSGVINAYYTGIENGGNIGVLNNSGTITASISPGIQNYYTGRSFGQLVGGTIGTLTNSGTISGDRFGVENDANIGTLNNSGLISNTGFVNEPGAPAAGTGAIGNFGTIGTLTNSGTIAGVSDGIVNNGTIGVLTNSGTISGSINAIANGTTLITSPTPQGLNPVGRGTIGGVAGGISMTNTGVIAGNITNVGAGDITIAGGTGTTFGTLTGFAAGTQGVITDAGHNLVLSGNQLLNDSVNLSNGTLTSGTLTNAGGDIAISSIVSITGNYSQATGTLAEAGGTTLIVSGAAIVTGGTVSGGPGVSNINYMVGDAGGTLIAGGAGSSYTGVTVNGKSGLRGLDITGSVNGNNLQGIVADDYIGASLGSLSNTGTIAAAFGLYVNSTGTLGSFNNSGVLNASNTGLRNNGGTLGTVTNSGTIAGLKNGLVNVGSIALVTNSGVIRDNAAPSHVGLSNFGSMGTLTNSGTISGQTGLANSGTLGAVNNSGTISGTIAVKNSGSLGPIANSGVIAGDIVNSSANALSISGGAGSVVGTLTGFAAGTKGTISNTKSDVALSGNLLLNDAINVGTGTVTNAGALKLSSIISVTGNFGQAAGSLTEASGSELVVSGAAKFTGGAVTGPAAASTGNYLAGTAVETLVAGGTGSSYTGITASIAGPTGLAALVAASGNNLVASALNDYVGGSLATLSNTGTIAQGYGLYIASTGTLGALSNSGTLSGSIAAIHNDGSLGLITNTGVIAGNIDDSSSANLSIAGGTGSIVGGLRGFASGSQGTITHTLADVVFTAGQQLLNDSVNVGTHNLVNSGATVQVANTIAVTGNLVQTGGTIIFGASSATANGDLVVSGKATLTGGTLELVPLGSTTLTTGQGYTIVQAANGLMVSGVTALSPGYGAAFSTISAGGYTDLVLTLSSLAQYRVVGNATGGAATGTGGALDQILASNSPAAQLFTQTVLNVLGALPMEQKQKAITQLSPGQLTPQSGSVVVSPSVNAVGDHQDATNLAMNGPDRGAAAGSDGLHGALWGQALVGSASRDSVIGASGYDARTYGVIAGFDLPQTPDLTLGGAISYINSRTTGVDMLTGSSTRVSSYQFTGYGSWRPDILDGKLTIDGQAAFGYNTFNQSRGIEFLHEAATAKFSGQQYLANVRASYAFSFNDGLSLTPYINIREIHLDYDAYQETGAGIANLNVKNLTTDSFTHEIGLKAGTEYDTSMGKLFPSLRLGWLHDYTNGPISLTSSLAGVVFNSATARPNADGFEIGAVLDLKHSDSFELTIEYDGEIRQDFQSHTGLIKGTFKF